MTKSDDPQQLADLIRRDLTAAYNDRVRARKLLSEALADPAVSLQYDDGSRMSVFFRSEAKWDRWAWIIKTATGYTGSTATTDPDLTGLSDTDLLNAVRIARSEADALLANEETRSVGLKAERCLADRHAARAFLYATTPVSDYLKRRAA
ncbi:hypothetical protein ACFZAM_31990 [Streptomyces sp. NPDC008079]|uniref:hypothetical protein n=1 Tax=Streptomyces sp. NPDC008079 TaxID=3364806 RepID=UPI0036E9F780